MSSPNKLDLSGLDNFSSLMNQGGKAAAEAGKPLLISVDLIDPDPNQPRREFDQAALQELADQIATRGVKSPISLRINPADKGRYVINHGERRWRASKLANKAEVPAFLDNDHNDIDQLAENIQRENLSTREIVDAIARKLADGMKQAEISRQLGKSKPWVSKHAALTELPAPLAELLATGRCRDASTLYEMLQCWKTDEAAVVTYLDGSGERQIVQADVEGLRAAIKRSSQQTAEPTAAPETAPGTEVLAGGSSPEKIDPLTPAGGNDGGENASSDDQVPAAVSATEANGGADGSRSASDDDNDPERKQNVKPSAATPDPAKVRKPLVQIRVGRREGVLLIAKRAAYGLAWVEYEDGSEEEVDANKVKLVAVTDGAKPA